MKDFVQGRFDAWISWKFCEKPQIEKFLLNHERHDLAVTALCREIDHLPARDGYMIKSAKSKTRFVAKMIDTAAWMYSKAALQNHEEKLLSKAEKQRRIDESDKLDRNLEAFEAEQSDLRKFYGIEGTDD